MAELGPVPFLRPVGESTQFMMNGRPRLLLGGQLHNSTGSSPSHVREVLARLAADGIRTVIGSASWAQWEPVEGTFDPTSVDAQLEAARTHGMHLVLIWFGAFKNAASTYAPSWVRRNPERFPRAVLRGGKPFAFTYPGAMPKPVLSVFASALLEADRRAFVRLMEHLAAVDTEHTVVMVQVENEMGVLGDSRDRSTPAEAAWHAPVPHALSAHLVAFKERLRPELAALWARQGNRRGGSWAEVFGDDWQAEEVFMAWAFATHADALARAGKAVLPLPMYANAWLGPQAGQPHAGDYPSGGPVARVIDVWKAAAPALDLVAPDIYVDDAKAVMAAYHRPDNPLFVPESRFRTGDLFWALGQHRAFGFSVFGIDDARPGSQFGAACSLLGEMEEVITTAQAAGQITAVLLGDEMEQRFSLGGYEIIARNARAMLQQMLLDAGLVAPPEPPPGASETQGSAVGPTPADDRPFALVIASGQDEFVLVGQGVGVDFASDTVVVELDAVEEGQFRGGQWTPGRLLNGDERLFLLPPNALGAVRIRVLGLPAPPDTAMPAARRDHPSRL